MSILVALATTLLAAHTPIPGPHSASSIAVRSERVIIYQPALANNTQVPIKGTSTPITTKQSSLPKTTKKIDGRTRKIQGRTKKIEGRTKKLEGTTRKIERPEPRTQKVTKELKDYKKSFDNTSNHSKERQRKINDISKRKAGNTNNSSRKQSSRQTSIKNHQKKLPKTSVELPKYR